VNVYIYHWFLDTREDSDLKELFVYKLLEKLGVGAQVYFVPNELHSRFIVYIASREISAFKTLTEIEHIEEGDLSNHSTAVVKMLATYTILDIADHHSRNMGVDNNGFPYIVDFYLITRGPLNIHKDFYDKVHGIKQNWSVLKITLFFLLPF